MTRRCHAKWLRLRYTAVRLLPKHGYCHGYVQITSDLFTFLPQSRCLKNARLIFNINTKHAYLPTTIFSDNRAAFVSQVLKKVPYVLRKSHKTCQNKTCTDQLACLRQQKLPWRKHSISKQANDDQCGTSISTLLSWTTTRRTTQAWDANIVEYSTDVFRTLFLVCRWAFVHRNHPCLILCLPKMSLTKPNWFFNMSAGMQCKPTSKTKATMTKKTKPSKLNERDYIYVLHPKADHQGNKNLFNDFRRIGH